MNQQILEKLIELEKLIRSIGVKNSETTPYTVLLNKEVEQKVEPILKGIELEDMHAKALSCRRRLYPEWILDSRASRHVTGAPK